MEKNNTSKSQVLLENITQAAVLPAAIFLIAMMMLIVARIILRFVSISIRGSYEIIEAIAVIVTACSIIFAAAKGSQIAIDMVISKFSLRGKLICRIIADAVGIAFWLLLAFASVWYALSIAAGESSMDLNIPYAPFKFFWAAGLVIYCLVLFKDIFTVIRDKEGKWTQSQ